jgi:hypothetical protein
MSGDIIQFPGSGKRPVKGNLALKPRPAPTFETLDPNAGRELFRVCTFVVDGAKELLDFVDGNREVARQAGVETIAIELSGILEGGQLERILDALEHSLSKGRAVQVTLDGLAKLRRAEGLLAEAGSNKSRYLPVRREAQPEAQKMGSPQSVPLIQMQRPSGTEGLFWFPLAFVGIGVLAIIVLAVVRESR